MLFYWLMLHDPLLSSTGFPLLFFLSIDWYRGAGVFRLIGVNRSLPALRCRHLLIIIIIPLFLVLVPS